jgi:hypothetical protein
MLQIFNNNWILGLSAFILYIIINKIINLCKNNKNKYKNEDTFTTYIGKNIPIITSYYVGL